MWCTRRSGRRGGCTPLPVPLRRATDQGLNRNFCQVGEARIWLLCSCHISDYRCCVTRLGSSLPAQPCVLSWARKGFPRITKGSCIAASLRPLKNLWPQPGFRRALASKKPGITWLILHAARQRWLGQEILRLLAQPGSGGTCPNPERAHWTRCRCSSWGTLGSTSTRRRATEPPKGRGAWRRPECVLKRS